MVVWGPSVGPGIEPGMATGQALPTVLSPVPHAALLMDFLSQKSQEVDERKNGGE